MVDRIHAIPDYRLPAPMSCPSEAAELTADRGSAPRIGIIGEDGHSQTSIRLRRSEVDKSFSLQNDRELGRQRRSFSVAASLNGVACPPSLCRGVEHQTLLNAP